ncbi:hypothetical protein DXG01_002283 [Tephrocybe rancida]|nr:hypothetical protein DXG01_002283 [Tephrocybe rancida]
MAKRLAAMFEVAFPEYYAKYKVAFDAGVWEADDPGPWLGRAVIWKMQVLPHRDGLDQGPAATFPMGYYSGGEMYFTDLGLKLSYGPGDVVISLAGSLYHAVGDWEPEVSPSTVSPGRVSHVFFFPKKSFALLEGKPAQWANNTMTGVAPHVFL